MKIGVLSDTHLYEVTPEFTDAVEKHFGDVDAVIHAGDTVAYAVYNYLEQFPLYAVAGNMDSPTLKELLKTKISFKVNGVRVGVIHGWGISHPIEENILKEFPDTKLIVYGHTHRPLIKNLPDGRLLFNPGSFRGSQPNFPPSIGLIEINGQSRVSAEIIYLTDRGK